MPLSCQCAIIQRTPLESCIHALVLAHAEAEEVARLNPSPYAEGYAAALHYAIEIAEKWTQEAIFEN
jgi:hypothetical protein